MKALIAALILAACTNVTGAAPIQSFDGPGFKAPSFEGPGRSVPSFDGPGFGPSDVRTSEGPARVETLGERR